MLTQIMWLLFIWLNKKIGINSVVYYEYKRHV